MKRKTQHHALAAILLACSAPVASSSTTLTFATTGATGVTATSGGPVLGNNPNSSTMLAVGTVGNYTATPTYGSNVTASSADNGAYLVNGTATPDIALAWSSTPAAANIIEGIGKVSPGWGVVAPFIANNGVGQLNSFQSGNTITITFTPAAGKAVLLQSIDLYKSANALGANQGRGIRFTVTGNATVPTTYTADTAISAVSENIFTFPFGAGLVGQPGETLVLSITRPAAATELEIIKAKLGAAFTATGNVAECAIDNLTFSQVEESEFAADTDGDGIADLRETYYHRTNPNSVDSDGDGIPDLTELTTTMTNPTVSNGAVVSYLVGAVAGGPVVQRSLQTGALGFHLDVQQSGNLTSWQPLPMNGGGVTTTPATDLKIDITGQPPSEKQFYRLKLNH